MIDLGRHQNWIKQKIKRTIQGHRPLTPTQTAPVEALFGISPWYEENLWEPTVQLALKDLCRPGDVVFDVGANFGGLTTAMSRAVGPKGVVCAFEASPRIVGILQRNIVHSGCNNVQVLHAAVFHHSHQKMPIFAGGHLNDSLYRSNSPQNQPFALVSSLALDDFVNYTGLAPNVIKMDIEGAEFDALRGAAETIKTHKPFIILELAAEDFRSSQLLKDLGYRIIDLGMYKEISKPSDYPNNGIRNGLFVHEDRLKDTNYSIQHTISQVKSLDSQSFTKMENGDLTLKEKLELPKGRFILKIKMEASGQNNEMMCGVRHESSTIFRYHAFTELLAGHYKEWVIDLPEKSLISLFFEFKNGTKDETFKVHGVEISKVEEFDKVARRPYL